MGLEMVLNDLSLLPLAENIHMARRRMQRLVETLVTAGSLKVERVLRTEYDVSSVELATGYPVARWLNDPEVDREARRYFRTLSTKAPYLLDVHDVAVLSRDSLSNFVYKKERSIGLGVAFLLDALAISFHSHSMWEMSILQLDLEQFQNDVITNELVSLKHACFREHILEHRDWIQARTQPAIRNGADFCTHYKALYSHIAFCESAIAQMQLLPPGNVHLRQIMKHLSALNRYCENWHNGPFIPHNIPGKITVESSATLLMYKKEHTFLCPDGTLRVFSWHCRVTPEPWRIYFEPLEQKRLIIVGYIGHHLPTVKFST